MRLLLLISVLFSLIYLPLSAQSLRVVNLRCEYRTEPLGVENRNPALSWQILSEARNVRQQAYQILVADSEEALGRNQGNYWDSGKVTSDSSLQISYRGKALQSTRSYYWKVKIWDNQNHVSLWSAPAFWQMGLLTPADWKGSRWIAYEKLADSLVNPLPRDDVKDKVLGSNILPQFRKSFILRKPIRKATAYVSGLGHFEMSLNGQKVGDHFLDPGWTKYDKEVQYVTFNITNQLVKGENVVGVMLGNGFYYIPPVKGRFRKLKVQFGYPRLIGRLHLEYQDGTSEDLVTNDSWRTAPSPITFSSIYGGENYDARLEQTGWDSAGFNDAAWKKPLLVTGSPALVSQMQEPLKIAEVFQAKSIRKTTSGEWLYDLGQNFSGIIYLKVKGNKGDTVRIYPAELLKDGVITQRTTGGPYYFEYILKGQGIETWQPRFTYYGFRYLQVRGGVPAKESNPGKQPEILELRGLHTRNVAPRTGSFSSSNTLLNQTHTLIDWAIKSNMASVFTDCPHREKLGWLEQVHLMGSSVRYPYDIAPLLKKSIQDMKDSQLENGLIPEIAPEYVEFHWGDGIFRDSPEWGSSAVLVPWYLYQWYGEKNELASSYPMMRRYVQYLGTKANNHILSQGLGDWYDLGPKPPGTSQLTPMGVTGTAMYYYDLTVLQEVARLLNKPKDAEEYKTLAEQVKQAFNEAFFNSKTKQYATNSQTANAMAVYMKLVNEADKPAVLEHLIKDIRSRNNGLTAGDIGYRYLLRVLEEAGRSDLIFDMNSRSDVPGYGYQIARGATALTESWEALPTSSNNHFMLGHLMEWLYAGLAGIKQQESSVAFREIVIEPQPVGEVTHAKATYESPYGLIISDWKKSGDTLELRVEIPANTTAILYFPTQLPASLSEEGEGKALQDIQVEKGKVKIKVGSGSYQFRSKID